MHNPNVAILLKRKPFRDADYIDGHVVFNIRRLGSYAAASHLKWIGKSSVHSLPGTSAAFVIAASRDFLGLRTFEKARQPNLQRTQLGAKSCMPVPRHHPRVPSSLQRN